MKAATVLILTLALTGIVVGSQSSAQLPIKAAPGVSYSVVASGLAAPRGLVFGPSGDLYLVEQSSGEVAKITAEGQVTRIARGLSDPHDVALDTQGTLYVADTGANRVARISPAGVVTTYISGLASPVDLAFNPQGELLVCELGSGRVVAFEGPKKMRIVAAGLQGPHGLAFRGRVTFINEWSGNRIVKVGPEGRVEPVAAIEVPVGLVVGRSGDLYAAQPQVGTVSRIKPDGSRITLIEGLKQPRDPAFDRAGRLHVAESGAGRILRLTDNF